MQQVPKTVFVSILRTKMTRCIAINILSIDIGARHQHRLYHSQVTSNRSYVEWRSEVPAPRINIRAILDKQIYQVDVSLIARHV